MPEIQQLQAFIKKKLDSYLQKPGYEIYFYSRMDNDSAVPPKVKLDKNGKPVQPSPTISFVSDLPRSDVAVVQSINIHNTLGENAGEATITLIEPVGINYFKPTIGDQSKDSTGTVIAPPDYDSDHFKGQQITTQSNGAQNVGKKKIDIRIGVMDTVLIKLKNIKSNAQSPDEYGTVFRGVVSTIQRDKSATGGSFVTIKCYDFAHWLRQISAISIGPFSTIALSLTNRALCFNMMNYANYLYSGQRSIFGNDDLDNDAAGIVKALSGVQNPANTTSSGNNAPAAGPTDAQTNNAVGLANVSVIVSLLKAGQHSCYPAIVLHARFGIYSG